jgi:hypothetical protein
MLMAETEAMDEVEDEERGSGGGGVWLSCFLLLAGLNSWWVSCCWYWDGWWG